MWFIFQLNIDRESVVAAIIGRLRACRACTAATRSFELRSTLLTQRMSVCFAILITAKNVLFRLRKCRNRDVRWMLPLSCWLCRFAHVGVLLSLGYVSVFGFDMLMMPMLMMIAWWSSNCRHWFEAIALRALFCRSGWRFERDFKGFGCFSLINVSLTRYYFSRTKLLSRLVKRKVALARPIFHAALRSLQVLFFLQARSFTSFRCWRVDLKARCVGFNGVVSTNVGGCYRTSCW